MCFSSFSAARAIMNTSFVQKGRYLKIGSPQVLGRRDCRHFPVRDADENRAASAVLEELHRALVLLRRRAGGERPQVAALTGPWIQLPRIEPVMARLELANHGDAPQIVRAARGSATSGYRSNSRGLQRLH